MTDIQAALGLSQLNRLDDFVKRRTEIANHYSDMLENQFIQCPWQHPDSHSSWHLYVIGLKLSSCRLSQKETFDFLRNSGIGVHIHYIPVHTQPYYQNLGFKKGDFPRSEQYYQQAITLPLFYDMKDSDVDLVIKTLGNLS